MIEELETLAVVWAVTHFRAYLFGSHVTIYTDHSAVRSVLLDPNETGKHARWWSQIFNSRIKEIEIVYQPVLVLRLKHRCCCVRRLILSNYLHSIQRRTHTPPSPQLSRDGDTCTLCGVKSGSESSIMVSWPRRELALLTATQFDS